MTNTTKILERFRKEFVNDHNKGEGRFLRGLFIEEFESFLLSQIEEAEKRGKKEALSEIADIWNKRDPLEPFTANAILLELSVRLRELNGLSPQEVDKGSIDGRLKQDALCTIHGSDGCSINMQTGEHRGKCPNGYEGEEMYCCRCVRPNEAYKGRSKKNIGQLRQWLNEDRITDPKKMVTNEEIETMLEAIK